MTKYMKAPTSLTKNVIANKGKTNISILYWLIPLIIVEKRRE